MKTQLNADGYYDLSSFRKWVSLFLIALGGGTIYLVPYLLATYVNQIQAFTKIPLTQLQLLVTVYGVVSLIFYIPGGWVADRVSTKTLFSFSMIGTGAISVWYSLLGFKAIHVDFGQLIVIHGLLAITTVLTFWSAFVKGVKLLGSAKEQAGLYAKCDMMRNIIGCIMGFITTALVSIVISNTIFAPPVGDPPVPGSGIFLLIFTLAAIYITTGILCLFFLPGELIQRSTKRNLEGFLEFRNSEGKIIICKDKSELSMHKKASRNYFWHKAWDDLKQSVKSSSVWLVSLLIFFIMNAYTAIAMFGTIFSANYGIDTNTASYLSTVYIYGTPIIGAILAGLFVQKKTKSASKALIYITIALAIFSVILFIVPMTSSGTKNTTIGIIGIVLISIIMIFIGGARGIYWATMTETRIPLSIAGLASGFISIVGFSKDIWAGPALAEMIKPHATNLKEGLYNRNAFIWLFGFIVVNAFFAILLSYLIYKKSLPKNEQINLVDTIRSKVGLTKATA